MSFDKILEQNIGKTVMFVLCNKGCSISIRHKIVDIFVSDDEIGIELNDGSEIIIREWKDFNTDEFGHYILPNHIDVFIEEEG